MIYWIAHGIFTVISKVLFPVKVHGREHIPLKGGFILASNHLSNLDPMILGIASGHRLSYLAKDSLFKSRVFRWVLHQVGAFPIKRESLDIGAIKEALRRLQKWGTVVFPEGTRIEEKKEVRGGIALLAVKSAVPVIPAFIDGSDKVLPAGAGFIKSRGPITVTFGKGLLFSKDKSYPEIADTIMAQINSLKPSKR